MAETKARANKAFDTFLRDFEAIRHQTARTKNCVSRNTLLGLVFQLALTAEKSWRKIRGFKRLPEFMADSIAE